MSVFVITGTDTDIGKTVCATLLTLALDAYYWKPIQCGMADGTDKKTVQELAARPDEKMLPEAYVLQAPLSPEAAAARENVMIDHTKLALPPHRPLVVEGAGGVMVPIDRDTLFVDLFQRWNAPLILCARTKLGTINHTLLAVEAIKRRNIPLHGLVMIGEPNEETTEIIQRHSGVKICGQIPVLENMSLPHLQKCAAELKQNLLI